MKTVLRSLIVVGVLALTTLAARSEAAPRWRAVLHNAQRNVAAGLERALDRVEATSKQRTQIRQILARSAMDLWGLRAEAVRLQDQIAAAVLADEPDGAELDRLERTGIKRITRGARGARAPCPGSRCSAAREAPTVSAGR